VSWHWAPTNRASANVLASLFSAAPADSFRVLTRRRPVPDADDAVPRPRIPTAYVEWPLSDDRPSLQCVWAELRTVLRMVCRATRMHADASFERIIGVYPSRAGLIAAWLISRRLRVPFVAYMHDLWSETTMTSYRAKRWFWAAVDRFVLSRAWMVVVPTKEFAEHYCRRGHANCWVLPHCRPIGAPAPGPDGNNGTLAGEELRLVYRGQVYEAHADAMRALLHAIRSRDDLELTIHSDPQPMLDGFHAARASRRDAMNAVRSADVCVVVLGSNAGWRRQCHGRPRDLLRT